nr:hypothetical protein DGKKSRWO_DGKKSRWO_CDS_0137 [uncultured phage]CAI9752314.1 hypothetical protein CVNMHQAP_CVNMHQAP_CDS_0137 [uncultured phage]
MHFGALAPTPSYGIVVEPSPVRSLAADCLFTNPA